MSEQKALHHPSISYHIEDRTLYLAGSLTIKEIDQDSDGLLNSLKTTAAEHLSIDLSDLETIDSAGVAYLHYIIALQQKRQKYAELINIPVRIQNVIEIFSGAAPQKTSVPARENYFERTGGHVYHFFNVTLRDYIYLLADLFYWSFTDFFKHTKSHRKGESINQAVLIGVNAVPIVGLISLLIGLVLALQSNSVPTYLLST